MRESGVKRIRVQSDDATEPHRQAALAASFGRLPAGAGARVSYDELVARPAETLGRLCAFLGVDEPAIDLASVCRAMRIPTESVRR
jgi:hypothetical protein